MKKVLFIATVVRKHINVFHLPFLKMFQEEGYTTYVAAANDTEQPNVTIPYCDHYVEIDFKRNPLHPGNIKSYVKLKKLINENDFEIIHCHTPVGGLLGRLASISARKHGTKVFYTAHGFHFYKGAPLKNWLLYYPVEKFCAHFTDVLITINNEDYALAKKKMKAKRVEYVPGVGIDLSKFQNVTIDRNVKRREIGVPEDAFVLTSVGEINENKNHEIIVRAIAELNNSNVHYVIAGIGNKQEHLTKIAGELGVLNQLHFLGFRKDIPEIDYVSDAFCFPSFREGLGLAAIEAMAAGLPIITSNIHGINDYSADGITGFKCDPTDKKGFSCSISKLLSNKELCIKMGEENKKRSNEYSINKILKIMKYVYEG